MKKFKDVFSKDYIGDRFNGLVIYNSMEFYTFSSLGDSYLESAKRLIDPFLKAEEAENEHQDDNLAHPIIFLLRHSCELYLKSYLQFLVSYNDSYPFFELQTDVSFVMGQHRLGHLSELIWKIVREKGLHQNRGFKSFLDFFYKFDQLDNNSTAFRYNVDIQNKPQRLHEDQWYVEILEFYQIVENLKYSISGVLADEKFAYESLNYFDQRKINEIELCVRKFKEVTAVFEEFKVRRKKRTVQSNGIVKPLTKEEVFELEKVKADIFESINLNFSDDDLRNACRGMYYGRDGALTNPVNALDQMYSKSENFKKWNTRADEYLKRLYSLKAIKDNSEKFIV